MAEIKSFPNNKNEYIGAEEVMKWLHGRTSGVFGANNNAAVAALAEPIMAVTVSDGKGWISNADGDGVVWWNDTEDISGTKLRLNIDAADGVLNRIDRIIVEWLTTTYADLPQIKVLKGTSASEATAPALTNNTTVRQISLARINVAAGTTGITATMITDERLDTSESVKADTSAINAQYNAAVAELERAIAEAWNGEISSGAVSQTFKVDIYASSWSVHPGDSGVYYCNRTVNGILATDNVGFVDVDTSALGTGDQDIPTALKIDEAWGNIFRVRVMSDNTVRFYAKEKPEVSLTVSITVIRK